MDIHEPFGYKASLETAGDVGTMNLAFFVLEGFAPVDCDDANSDAKSSPSSPLLVLSASSPGDPPKCMLGNDDWDTDKILDVEVKPAVDREKALAGGVGDGLQWCLHQY